MRLPPLFLGGILFLFVAGLRLYKQSYLGSLGRFPWQSGPLCVIAVPLLALGVWGATRPVRIGLVVMGLSVALYAWSGLDKRLEPLTSGETRHLDAETPSSRNPAGEDFFAPHEQGGRWICILTGVGMVLVGVRPGRLDPEQEG